MDLDKQIKELTGKWMDYVGDDHHKDRDCHFYIYTDYQYEGDVVYTAEHNGYIGKEFSQNFGSYSAAQKGLLELMTDMIEDQREWVERVLKQGEPHWDSWQVTQAKKFIKLFGEQRARAKVIKEDK